MTNVGLQLKNIRKERKLTRKDVCKDTGLSINTLKSIENIYVKSASYKHILILCKYYDISPDDFNNN